MLVLLVLFCAILKPSLSIPYENGEFKRDLENSELKPDLHGRFVEEKYNIKSYHPIQQIETHNKPLDIHNNPNIYIGPARSSHMKNEEIIKGFNKEEKEYFFLSDVNGNVSFIDAISSQVTLTYELPSIKNGIAAIVNGIFYNIDTLKGEIRSADIASMVSTDPFIEWTYCNSFPKENEVSRNIVAANDSFIYFVTQVGILYSYNIKTNGVTKHAAMTPDNVYASLVVIDNIVYIFKGRSFYAFNGRTITELGLPDLRENAGLFENKGQVCVLGGNRTIAIPDPVNCYDPKSTNWNCLTNLEEFRWDPAIAIGPLGIYVFGGYAKFYQSTTDEFWRDTTLVFSPDTKTWIYLPSIHDYHPVYPQAIFFTA